MPALAFKSGFGLSFGFNWLCSFGRSIAPLWGSVSSPVKQGAVNVYKLDPEEINSSSPSDKSVVGPFCPQAKECLNEELRIQAQEDREEGQMPAT